MRALRRLSPDELREEMEIAAAHGKLPRFWRCFELWLEKMDRAGWTPEELARYMAAKFREGLH